mgnify:FL=1
MQAAVLKFPEVSKLKQWAKCGFCGRPDPYDGVVWKFIPMLLEDRSRGAKACPDCAPGEMQKLIDAGILIPRTAQQEQEDE